MVTRSRAILLVILPAIAILSLSAACDKVPLLAPTGSVITLFATSSTVAGNGEIEIIATVIEQGTAAASTTTGSGTGTTAGAAAAGAAAATTTSTGTRGAGTPVQNGTLVSFATTMGRIEPREARTNNGEVRVKFFASGQSGTARITAYSGGASATLDNLLVGAAAAKRIVVSAGALPASGGSTEVQARVEDETGNAIVGVPVTFSTTAGTLSLTSATTDANGIARTTITTDRQAEVTATAGAQTAKATVSLAPRLLSSFSADPPSTTAGTPVRFTVGAGANANLQDAVINFGDGTSQSLGSFTGNATATHVYSSPGNYTATVTARDALGGSQTQSTTVTIGALPVTLSGSPNPATVGQPVTFTASGTGTAQVARYQWTFDDGTTASTSGPSMVRSFGSKGEKVARVDVIGVNGGNLGSAETRITVQ